MLNTYLIILASGSGERLNSVIPKQYLDIENEKIIDISINIFTAFISKQNIIVAINQNHIKYFQQTRAYANKIKYIHGGATRQQSCAQCLEYIKTINANAPANVIIHDAARPLFIMNDMSMIHSQHSSNTFAISNEKPNNDQCYIYENYQIQTPQMFGLNTIYAAHQKAKIKNYRDDTSIILDTLNIRPKIFIGQKENIKITTTQNLKHAKDIYRTRIRHT